MSNVSNRVRFIALTFALALSLAPAAFAQDGMSGGNTRTVASGQKMKIKGVVTSRQRRHLRRAGRQRRLDDRHADEHDQRQDQRAASCAAAPTTA